MTKLAEECLCCKTYIHLLFLEHGISLFAWIRPDSQMHSTPWNPLATVGYLLESCKLLNCAWTSVRKRRFG
eukprot:jgi/Botrbrau1/15109/Bobra.0303s0002.1